MQILIAKGGGRGGAPPPKKQQQQKQQPKNIHGMFYLLVCTLGRGETFLIINNDFVSLLTGAVCGNLVR